ncbi:hypothetical protein FACS189445_0810 [Spirochaetia bacterium]|nr:hypothetical protein FACS189445_0810 [Spirochaetia bacterium]
MVRPGVFREGDNPNIPPGFGETLKHGKASIGGPVIHKNILRVRAILERQGPEQPRHAQRLVTDGDNHRNEGLAGGGDRAGNRAAAEKAPVNPRIPAPFPKKPPHEDYVEPHKDHGEPKPENIV